MSSRDGLRERSWRTAIGEGVVVAAEERAVRESQAGVTGDARAWVAGALASSPSTMEKGNAVAWKRPDRIGSGSRT